MDLELRRITEEEVTQFLSVEHIPFGLVIDDREIQAQSAELDVERSVAAFASGELVGTAGAYTVETTVPGLGLIPTAGVAYVAVLPTHRRRGVLRAMMRHQLDDIHRRGEPLAALTASEGSIYGRFGYGIATYVAAYSLDRARASRSRAGRQTDGRVCLLTGAQASEAFPLVFEKARRGRVGEISRAPGWWPEILFDEWRNPRGVKSRFFVAHTDQEGTIDGYAVYQVSRKSKIPHDSDMEVFDRGTALVHELVTTSQEAQASLFDFVCEVDLTQRIAFPARPFQDPLRLLVDDPRQYRMTWEADHLWVRLVDLREALPRRSYLNQGTVTMEVIDPFCPWNQGVWRLHASPEGAEVSEQAEGQEEISIDVGDLASLYMGGIPLSILAQAGRVREHSPGAIQRADALFAGFSPPFCSTDF